MLNGHACSDLSRPISLAAIGCGIRSARSSMPSSLCSELAARGAGALWPASHVTSHRGRRSMTISVASASPASGRPSSPPSAMRSGCAWAGIPGPRAAIMDARSVKTVEESAPISGDDGHKRVEGRKRHLLVETRGLPISLSVMLVDTHDKGGTRRSPVGLVPLVPRLAKIWSDGAYTSGELARWCKGYGGWDLEIVGRDPETQEFAVQPRRWVVEPGAPWAVLRGWCATAACGSMTNGWYRRARHSSRWRSSAAPATAREGRRMNHQRRSQRPPRRRTGLPGGRMSGGRATAGAGSPPRPCRVGAPGGRMAGGRAGGGGR